jgi:ATP-dependent protease HslVU (ClpYQ) peptidase subunit
MTCIAGLVDGTSGRVVMGGDSCAFSGWDITPGVVKVFHNGPCLIGTSGDTREGQLLRYALTVPEQPEDMEPQHFMSTVFVDALRTCFKDAGYAQKEKEKEEHDGRLLVAYQGHLFGVYGNYAVLEASTGFNAIGVGEDYAKGVLFATTAATLTAEARVLLALQAAEALSAGVRGPFTIEILEPPAASSAHEATEDLSALALTPSRAKRKRAG